MSVPAEQCKDARQPSGDVAGGRNSVPNNPTNDGIDPLTNLVLNHALFQYILRTRVDQHSSSFGENYLEEIIKRLTELSVADFMKNNFEGVIKGFSERDILPGTRPCYCSENRRNSQNLSTDDDTSSFSTPSRIIQVSGDTSQLRSALNTSNRNPANTSGLQRPLSLSAGCNRGRNLSNVSFNGRDLSNTLPPLGAFNNGSPSRTNPYNYLPSRKLANLNRFMEQERNADPRTSRDYDDGTEMNIVPLSGLPNYGCYPPNPLQRMPPPIPPRQGIPITNTPANQSNGQPIGNPNTMRPQLAVPTTLQPLGEKLMKDPLFRKTLLKTIEDLTFKNIASKFGTTIIEIIPLFVRPRLEEIIPPILADMFMQQLVPLPPSCTCSIPVPPSQGNQNPRPRPTNPNGRPTNPNGRPTNPNGRPANPNGRPINPNGRPTNPNGRPTNPCPVRQNPNTLNRSNPSRLPPNSVASSPTRRNPNATGPRSPNANDTNLSAPNAARPLPPNPNDTYIVASNAAGPISPYSDPSSSDCPDFPECPDCANTPNITINIII